MTADAAGPRRPKRTGETIAALRREIVAGRFADARRLPGERQLADLMRVSRTTLRRALSDLVGEGLLSQRQGLGTLVNPHAPEKEPAVRFAAATVVTSGLSADVDAARDLGRAVGRPSVEEAMALALPPDAAVVRFSRLLMVEDGPLALERATVPRGLLSEGAGIGRADIGGPPDGLLAGLGLRPVRRLLRLRCTAPTRAEAEHLDLGLGSTVLWRWEVFHLADGRGCMTIRTLYRLDRVDLMALAETSGLSA